MSMKVVVVVMLVVVGVVGGNRNPPPSLPSYLDPTTCPPTYEEHPLVLISMDGFRVEYLRKGLTPNLNALKKEGVSPPYMKPSFPTITFPNHYTIVTGLYPPSHGIVANKFYDPDFDAVFRVGRPESFQKRWWGGEPIWTTLNRQGKKSATFYWPGSEVEGHHPTYWYYYNESVPLTHRVDKMLAWLELPPDTRPSFVTLYIHDPDSTGHDYGPNSPQMDAKLVELDAVVGQVIEGLRARSLLPCVNLILLSDHGMAEAGQEKLINLDDYLPKLPEQARFWGGGYAAFTPNDDSPENKEAMMRALTCKRKEMRVYERELLPVRWHMGAQRRVEAVVVEVDPGYTVGEDSTFEADEGEHGYDEHFASMNALFLGYGPDLARHKKVEVFQNIELYNLMCHLLGVTPAANNGTWGSLHHLLARPPPPPPSSEIVLPVTSQVPQGLEEDLSHLLSVSQCEGDNKGSGAWLELLKEAQKVESDVVAFHAPWGTPQGREEESVLLLQPDSVTAYSSKVRLPLWTSFGVTRARKALKEEQGREWRTDPRLGSEDAPSCPAYTILMALNVTANPLFPPEFSYKESEALPFLISNAVPLTTQAAGRWRQVVARVSRWARLFGPLNVVAGPVMDYNSDSLADDMTLLGRDRELVVPSHIFLVVTRCVAPVSSLTQCPHHKLDVLAFILPQYIPVTNCLEGDKYLQQHSAKVKEVEGVTGLQLFPKLDYYHRATLRIRMHSHVWARGSWDNRLLDYFLQP